MPLPLQTASLKVEPDVIRAYAELTRDYNPIHLDPEFAARTPMGGVIAHGTMSIGLLWQAVFRSFGAAAFSQARLQIRFVAPVRCGEVLSAGGEPDPQQPGRYQVWVRDAEGKDRLSGTLDLASPPPA